MPWEYSQSTGQLRHNGTLIATGYSGAGMNSGTGRNNPAMEAVRGGVWDYLTKPVDADQLMAVLEKDEAVERVDANAATPATLERVEWEHLQRVLADCGGNISQAAKVLGLHRRSLQRKLGKMPPSR